MLYLDYWIWSIWTIFLLPVQLILIQYPHQTLIDVRSILISIWRKQCPEIMFFLWKWSQGQQKHEELSSSIIHIIIIFPQPVLGAFVLSQSSPHQQREQPSNSHWYFYVNYVLFKATGFQRKLLIYSAPVQKDQISTNFFTQRSTTSLVFPPHPLGSDKKTSFF